MSSLSEIVKIFLTKVRKIDKFIGIFHKKSNDFSLKECYTMGKILPIL